MNLHHTFVLASNERKTPSSVCGEMGGCSATRMLRKKLTKVALAAFEAWKMETKRSKQVKKVRWTC